MGTYAMTKAKRPKRKAPTYERFIVQSGGLYGHYGLGETVDVARQNWRRAGGKKKEGNYREFRFYGKLPFAPTDRDAKTTEADCWVNKDGSHTWQRCEREELTD